MFLRDGHGIIRRCWGGYSPKLYDGHWLEVYKEWLEKHLKGASVVADQHFEWGKTSLKGVTFFTHIKKPAKPTKSQLKTGKDIKKLTIEQQKMNKDVRETRARIENVFGYLKTHFKVLAVLFLEDQEQLDAIVHYTSAIHNTRRQHHFA